MWYVYLIIDPITKRAVYVGMTSDVSRRANMHAYSPNSYVGKWTRSCRDLGYNVELVTVAYFSQKNEAAEAERRLIEAIPNLMNKKVRASSGRPVADKPWEREGISRMTWYRRKKEAAK